MNKDEIKKGLENCKRLGGFKGCSKCPYFSTQRCNDTLCEDALNLINEQEKEVERLKDELTKLKSEVNDYKQRYESSEKRYFELMQSSCEALRAKEEHFQEKCKKTENNIKSVIEIEKKQTVKDFAEKIKDYFENKVIDAFGDMVVDVKYLTIDIDEFEEYVDELLKEYEE